ncbi:hypothetical protein FB451DRAFT_1409314 [Mycena latifolia]|nr:hypothetical protein FB451DRAFT_1409314 [Mycena latifolia]
MPSTLLHPLLVIDYQHIRARDTDEIEQLWTAATKLGFWYLKNHGVEDEVDRMFDMTAETMALPLKEKMKYDIGTEGMSFGYKAAGTNAINAAGVLDTAEFLNIAKDNALVWPAQVHRAYPPSINARMESTIVPFVKKSVAVNTTLVDVLNDKLGLPPGSCIHATSAAGVRHGPRSALPSRIGKSSPLTPPLPGHAICNLGDAMAIFSGGILRSNIHRVVNPPGEQGSFPRYSLVYFMHPADPVETVHRSVAVKSSVNTERRSLLNN